MLLFFLLGSLLFILTLFIIMAFRAPAYYQGPITDHFNGKTFFNPGNSYKNKSTTDLFRWWFSRNRQKWPEQVENKPHTPLPPLTLPKKVRVTFVNHATVLIQTQEMNILTDPTWAERASPFSFIGPKRVRKPGISFDELPNIDLVLVSHNHYDHLNLETLVKLNHKFHPIFLVPLGNKSFLEPYHIENVVELDWWQSYRLKSAIITFLPTKHWSSRWLNDKFRTLWGSYGIQIADKKIYFAGDTGFSAKNFTNIQSRWGAPDLALLPIGSYKPEWFMQDNHMNPQEAVQAHLLLKAKHSIPIHYGTFQLSDEGIDEPVSDLEKALKPYSEVQLDFNPLLPGLSQDY